MNALGRLSGLEQSESSVTKRERAETARFVRVKDVARGEPSRQSRANFSGTRGPRAGAQPRRAAECLRAGR